MKATLLFHEKRVEAGGTIIEMTIWRLEEPVPPSVHRFKYSLFYGRDGRRIIGFDNERGKGDHFHLDGEERDYTFRSVEQLMRDFQAEIARTEAGQ